MNDEMKAVLLEYLKKLLSVTEKGLEWSAEQIPLIIQEKLTYDFWFSAAWLVVVTIVFVGANAFVWRLVESYRDDYNKPNTQGEKIAIRGTTGLFTILVYVLIGGILAENVLKIYLAPRLYILEWLRDAVR